MRSVGLFLLYTVQNKVAGDIAVTTAAWSY